MAPNHWGAPNTAGLSLTTTCHSSPQQDLQLSRIKQVFSDHYHHLNYTQLLGSSLNPSSITHHQFSLMTNQLTNLQSDDIRTKFLLKPFSSAQLSPGDLPFSSPTGFSQIFPGANLSDFNQETIPGSLDILNLQAVDHLRSSSRFSGNFTPASYGLDHDMHQPYQIPLQSSNKMSSDGAAEAKRSSCSKLMEAKTLQTAPKKSRVEARASCPPFKVRKEKLGDRIAALQQLVAPFGKTDTASVLMEAIGYIKFLHTQVQTLSLPYLKNTSTGTHTTTIIKAQGGDGKESEEAKRELRSGGLCLVPLSCITDGGGAVIWPPN
ncbi:transcription factor bHLH110 isoform X1 [Sesamum indicum]|uniref:Transcription factor bHLH110 isoform X1 n=1 Tax=Sesamum indicum TaxID=4182 RepID=A0A6I9SV70_SESIN|nr:transcription factor bHLH110 isoform X1 [Sesamum indicum]